MRREQRRWATRFGSFVGSYTVEALARDLGIANGSRAVYEWLSGRTDPRPAHAREMVRISGGAITFDDVYRHREEMADGGGAGECGRR